MKTLKDYGEVSLIHFIKKFFKNELGSTSFLPYGDDAFGIDPGGYKKIIVNSDMFVNAVDNPPNLDLFCGGWKLVTMNVSDIIAKGATPMAFILSIAAPSEFSFAYFTKFLSGIRSALQYYNIKLIGGDLNEGPDLIADGTVIGVAKNNVHTRFGAKAGDILATTGEFGDSALGLKILLNEIQIDKREFEHFREKVCKPIAPVDKGLFLSLFSSVTSVIDSSDGLVRSLYELSRCSNVGFELTNVPISLQVKTISKKYDLNPLSLALFGGEEYELIFTVKAKEWDMLLHEAEQRNLKLYPLGRVISEKKILLKTDKDTIELDENGWTYFR